jgi:hypothetical protein
MFLVQATFDRRIPSTVCVLTCCADTSGRKSQYSTISQSSSDRTTLSNRSVFSTTSQWDSALSEESFEDGGYGSSVQLEAVERGSRTGSKLGDHVVKAAQAPFGRALAKMESAGARIIAARLSEEWDGLEDDDSYQEVIFEKRLWALTAYQRLTQNKQLQSPAHDILSNSRPADQRRILHLNGSLGMYYIRELLSRKILTLPSGWMDACDSVPSSNCLYSIFNEELQSANILPSPFESPLSLRPFSLISNTLSRQLLRRHRFAEHRNSPPK